VFTRFTSRPIIHALNSLWRTLAMAGRYRLVVDGLQQQQQPLGYGQRWRIASSCTSPVCDDSTSSSSVMKKKLGLRLGPLAKLIYIVRPTGCTTGCKSVYTMEWLDVGLHESKHVEFILNRLYNRLVQWENVCIHDAAGCTTDCTAGCAQVQRVASCIRGFSINH